MGPKQAAGYLFEEEIRDLLKESGFVDVKTEPLEGRGTDHQIDAYGVYSIPVPFTYPIRIIAEAKCYEKSIELPQIRSFFGVITDVSENYFVKRGDKKNKTRYLDTGCFFSANNYTRNSQDFAWAHNIFLVSFSGIDAMQVIVKNIRDFLTKYEKTRLRKISKNNLIVDYQKWQEEKQSQDNALFQEYPSLVFGIIDKVYPVVLVGNKGWHKKIKISPDSDKIGGVKISRTPQTDGTLFEIVTENMDFHMDTFYFTLPDGIAEKIVARIDKTEMGANIFDLDIPLITWNNKQPVRRIITIEVTLPGEGKAEYYRQINQEPKH